MDESLTWGRDLNRHGLAISERRGLRGKLRMAEKRLWRRTRYPSGLHPLFLVSLLAATFAHTLPRVEPTVESLKAKLSSASVGDKPHLCIDIAKMQLAEADKLYAASDIDKAEAVLTDVVTYSEMARDYSIQSHKYQKQSEIAVRAMIRKLSDIQHSVGTADQAALKDAVSRLDRVRDDLLKSMFKKGVT